MSSIADKLFRLKRAKDRLRCKLIDGGVGVSTNLADFTGAVTQWFSFCRYNSVGYERHSVVHVQPTAVKDYSSYGDVAERCLAKISDIATHFSNIRNNMAEHGAAEQTYYFCQSIVHDVRPYWPMHDLQSIFNRDPYEWYLTGIEKLYLYLNLFPHYWPGNADVPDICKLIQQNGTGLEAPVRVAILLDAAGHHNYSMLACMPGTLDSLGHPISSTAHTMYPIAIKTSDGKLYTYDSVIDQHPDYDFYESGTIGGYNFFDWDESKDIKSITGRKYRWVIAYFHPEAIPYYAGANFTPTLQSPVAPSPVHEIIATVLNSFFADCLPRRIAIYGLTIKSMTHALLGGDDFPLYKRRPDITAKLQDPDCVLKSLDFIDCEFPMPYEESLGIDADRAFYRAAGLNHVSGIDFGSVTYSIQETFMETDCQGILDDTLFDKYGDPDPLDLIYNYGGFHIIDLVFNNRFVARRAMQASGAFFISVTAPDIYGSFANVYDWYTEMVSYCWNLTFVRLTLPGNYYSEDYHILEFCPNLQLAADMDLRVGPSYDGCRRLWRITNDTHQIPGIGTAALGNLCSTDEYLYSVYNIYGLTCTPEEDIVVC